MIRVFKKQQPFFFQGCKSGRILGLLLP